MARRSTPKTPAPTIDGPEPASSLLARAAEENYDVIVTDVKEHSADTTSFATELLRRMNEASPDSNVELLLSRSTLPNLLSIT